MAHNWKSFTNLPSLTNGFSPGTMILLSDGSVLVHNETFASGAYQGKEWFRLTPDTQGKYENGTWTGPFSMTNTRQFFASGVLRDGRVFVLGGEYSDAGNGTPLGEIFDPLTNTWSAMTKPSTFNWIKSDVSACILPDGRVLFGALLSNRTAIWDPVTNDWREAGLAFGASAIPTKQGTIDEETWTLLQDGTVLTVQINANPLAEKYIPDSDQWVTADQSPPTLTQPLALMNLIDTTNTARPSINISEIGPAIVLPNGNLFVIGGTGHTAIYTPPASPAQPGTWAAGPDLPPDTSGNNFNSPNGNIQTAIDAPAVLLTGGKVLLVAGNTKREVDSSGRVSFWSNPSNVYVYDPAINATPTLLNPQPPSNSVDSWVTRFLLLPTGQVLFTTQKNMIAMLTVDTALLGSPDASWKPVITDFPAVLAAGHNYVLSGKLFNGLSQACSYGDDAQMATNFPIVRISNTSSNKVRYLRSFNFSTLGIATGNDIVTTNITVPSDLDAGQYLLEVICNGIPSNAVTVQVVKMDCFFIVDRSTYAQGEIQAMINAIGTPAVIDPALYVVVEGFKPGELGLNLSNLNNPPIKPAIPDPVPGIKIEFSGMVIPEDPSMPGIPQRFTFPYKVSFQNGTTIFNFTPSSETLTLTATLTATGTTIAAQANIELTKNPNPFILHGDTAHGYPWYLSVDLKVFMVKGGGTKFSMPLPAAGVPQTVATNWIQQLITAFNNDRASAATLFDALPSDENLSEIALAPTDVHGTPVYNFALARLRYRDTIPANNVRLFFRMWPAQQTNAAYGNPTTLYRTFDAGGGTVVPLLGIQGDEIMTIPFFATPRVHTDTTDSMQTQRDAPNVQPVINPSLLGGEVDTYFGAWLDINQPGEKLFPVRMNGGIAANIPDGPFTGMGNLLSIEELVRSEHQCLLAEVSFDLTPIPANGDPSNCDKLAQRNLAFVNVPNPGLIDSRMAPQIFEVRPTPFHLRFDLKPDEIMIEWGTIPSDSIAQIYLPAVAADDILKLASELYTTHHLSKIDSNTLQCITGGVTFIPLPRRTGPNFTSLITVDLPVGIKKGQVYHITVKQITAAIGLRKTIKHQQIENIPGFQNNEESVSSETHWTTVTTKPGNDINWRRVLGVFMLTIPVSTKEILLQPEERKLSIMRWIGKSIPTDSRWYLVFMRYLEQLSARIKHMGGDPSIIVADPNGSWKKHTPKSEYHHKGEELISHIGKICELIYDRFGDFEGFVLDTEDSLSYKFFSREHEIEDIVKLAWRERIVVSVLAKHNERHYPFKVILKHAPRPYQN